MAEDISSEQNSWEANDPTNLSAYPTPPPASAFVQQLYQIAVGAVAVSLLVMIYYFVTVGRHSDDVSLMALLVLVVYPALAVRRAMKPQSVRVKRRPGSERGWWRHYEIVRRTEYVLAIWWGALASVVLLVATTLHRDIPTSHMVVYCGLPAYAFQWWCRRALVKSTEHLA